MEINKMEINKMEINKMKINKMKINKMKILNATKLAFALALAQVADTKAASVFFDSTTFSVRDSSGSQLLNTTDNKAAIGYFADGFTATAANYSQWLANFKGITGYTQKVATTTNASLGNNQISAGITLLIENGPLFDPGEGSYDRIVKVSASQGGSFLGLAPSELLRLDKQFSLILWNSNNIGTATQAGVFTSTAWNVPATGAGSFSTSSGDNLDMQFGASTLTSVVGTSSYVTGSRFVQLAAIPEPSSASLLAIGVAGLVALRARRKS